MVTAVVAVTELVVTGKRTATASAGTVTLAGTVTEGESEMSVTTAPPAGAAALKTDRPRGGAAADHVLRVQGDEVEGRDRVPGVTASVVLCVVPSVAEIVAVVSAVTALVVTGNVALVAPAGTVTLAGTVTAVELSERGTTSPPAGATEFSTTVPVAAVPPVTLAWSTLTEESDGFVPVG